METEDLLDIPQFRKHLREMQEAFKEGMVEDDEYPEELDELLAAMDRLEKELANQKSQQLLADFFMVYSFIQTYSEEIDEDEFDEDEEFEDDDEQW